MRALLATITLSTLVACIVRKGSVTEFANTIDQITTADQHGLVAVRSRKHLLPGAGCDKYPAVGALVRTKSHELHCTASVIAPTLALTAAHCLVHIDPKTLEFRVGNNIDEPVAAVPVVAAITLPEYRPGDDSNDLAVLTLGEPIAGLTPLDFRDEGMPADTGIALEVTGFGYSSANGVSGVGVKRCTSVTIDKVEPRRLLYDIPVYGVCHGDSGGPALQGTKIAGVTSWGNRDCVGRGGLVNVGKYSEWLREQIAASSRDAVREGGITADGHIRKNWPCEPSSAHLCEPRTFCASHSGEAKYFCKNTCTADSDCPGERCSNASSPILGAPRIRLCGSGESTYWPEKQPAAGELLETRVLDVYLEPDAGKIRDLGGDLSSNYLTENWKITELSNIGVGDIVEVSLAQDGMAHDCALLDVLIATKSVRNVIGHKSQPSPSTNLNHWLGSGWRKIATTKFGNPVIEDRELYAVCK